jgi:pyruvate kinase
MFLGCAQCIETLRTDSESVLRQLTARWGVLPILLPLAERPEDNVQQTFECVPRNAVLHDAACVNITQIDTLLTRTVLAAAFCSM